MDILIAASTAPPALRIGALVFGAVVGWNAYFINRYRQTVVIGDLSTLISAVGGGAILALFPAHSVTFGYYGIGLGAGFFAYFVVMAILVMISKQATVDWILGFGTPAAPPTEGSAKATDPPPVVERPFFAMLNKPPAPPL